MTINEIQDEINAMLEDSPEEIAEDWAIHDYEAFGARAVVGRANVRAVGGSGSAGRRF